MARAGMFGTGTVMPTKAGTQAGISVARTRHPAKEQVKESGTPQAVIPAKAGIRA
jgi:hypothetical protein